MRNTSSNFTTVSLAFQNRHLNGAPSISDIKLLCNEYRIIYYGCFLGSLINHLVCCWAICAKNKLQKWKKGMKWLAVYSQRALEMFKKTKQRTAEWWMTVYCLMPLVYELPSSVRLPGITSTHQVFYPVPTTTCPRRKSNYSKFFLISFRYY